MAHKKRKAGAGDPDLSSGLRSEAERSLASTARSAAEVALHKGGAQ